MKVIIIDHYQILIEYQVDKEEYGLPECTNIDLYLMELSHYMIIKNTKEISTDICEIEVEAVSDYGSFLKFNISDVLSIVYDGLKNIQLYDILVSYFNQNNRLERWRIVDKNEKDTGRTVLRGERMKPGEYHQVVSCFIVDKSGNFLIQQRAESKSHGGTWANTVGSVEVSDVSLYHGALREVKEELGIDLKDSTCYLIGKHQFELGNWIRYEYLFIVDDTAFDFVLQPEEVQAVKWVSTNELQAMFEDETYVELAFVELKDTILSILHEK